MLKNENNIQMANFSQSTRLTCFPQRTEQETFICNQIAFIIKTQIRRKRQENKIRQDLDLYNKIKEKNNHNQGSKKLEKHRRQNKQIQQSRQEAYIKRNQQKQNRMKSVNQKKKEIIQERKKEKQSRQFAVRNNYLKINESLLQSLSEVPNENKKSKYRPPVSSSLINLNKLNFKKELKNAQQNEDEAEETGQTEEIQIMKFLQKQRKIAEINLRRELEQIKRIEKNKASKVTCNIKLRSQMQEARKEKVEKRYLEKSAIFEKNLQRIKDEKMQSSFLRCQQNLNKIPQKQEQNLQEIQSHVSSRSHESVWSPNKLQDQKKRLFMTRNFQRKKKEKRISLKEKTLKELYQKMNMLKNMGGKQLLNSEQKKNILSHLHKSIPQYAEIQAFLSSTKESFIYKKIEEEEEQKKRKARKIL